MVLLHAGMISRGQAEEQLEEKEIGSYLVRVSERIFGYAISYRDEARCKHYLINALDNKYQFFGSNQAQHSSLRGLLDFHKVKPTQHASTQYSLDTSIQSYPCLFCDQKNSISQSGGEILKYAVGQQNPAQVDFQELFEPSSPQLETTKL